MNFSSTPFWMGLSLSILWVAVVAFALMSAGAAQTFGGLPLASWAIGVSAVVSPVAMIWMVTAYLQRAADVQSVAEPLRRQLAMITGESGAAEVRIRRFNQAIREQLELLRTTRTISHDDLMATMDRVRQHKNELEQFEQHSIYQVKEIQDVIRNSMQHIDQLMEDKFTMLRVLDNKLMQSGDEIGHRTEVVREQLVSMLQEIEANAQLVGVSLERSMRETKKIAETARMQETNLLDAAESTSNALQDMSSKIDLNVAHFLERASAARTETERLVDSFRDQTRSLEDLGNSLPTRVSEAEAALTSVADRLQATEYRASEKALELSEKLSSQADNLQRLLEHFSSRCGDIDSAFQKRHTDLGGMVTRINAAASDLSQQLEGSLADLDHRAQDNLRRYTTVNEDARRNVEGITSQMAEISNRYETVMRQLNSYAGANTNQLNAVSTELANQMKQIEALHNASQKASVEVQDRASVALQNMQQVLERLVSTRDATQNIGEALTDKLRGAVDQNESIIVRLNEAAQMTVHSLGLATESLSQQESTITDKAQSAEGALRTTVKDLQEQATAAEKAMREQNASLMTLLKETQDRLESADRQLQSFAVNAATPVQQAVEQIETSAAKGAAQLGHYSENMQDQLTRLLQFNARINNMGEDVTRMTTETLDALEKISTRFQSARETQEITAREVIGQFQSVADRLQGEVGSLDDCAIRAITTLRDAVGEVSEQTQILRDETDNSGSNLKRLTSSLREETADIHFALEKQADDLNTDLSRVEQRFVVLNESLKQRADDTSALLDRMAEHYNEMTRATSAAFEERAALLGQSARAAYSDVDNLSAALAQQLNLIGNGTTRLDAHATQIAESSSTALERLNLLNSQLVTTQETTLQNAHHAIGKLSEVGDMFTRQTATLDDAAQNAVILVQKAGIAFDEQTLKLLDSTTKVEENVRSLNTATMMFADETEKLRTAIEDQNQNLLSTLSTSIGQFDSVGGKMQQVMADVTTGTNAITMRFNDMAEAAASRLNSSSDEIAFIANKAETTLGALGVGISQQIASLNLVSEQLDEQRRILTAANENQCTQLTSMFDRIGTAHNEASSVAERAVNRLTDILQQVHAHLDLMDDKSKATLDNIASVNTGFNDQANLLLANAQKAEEQARTVLDVTASLQDKAKQLHEALNSESERAAETLSALFNKLGTGQIELRDFTAESETALARLKDGMDQRVSTLDDTMARIATRQDSLVTALEAQHSVLNNLLTRLSQAQSETASATEGNVAKLAEGAQHITQQIETLGTKAQEALIAIRTADSGFLEEADKLDLQAQQAEKQARTLFASVASFQTQSQQIRDALNTESERTNDIMGSLLGKLGASHTELRDLGLSTETALQSLHGTVEAKIATLAKAMQDVVAHEQTLTPALESQRETLNTLLARLVQAQDETALAAENNVARLTESAEQVTKQLAALGTQADSTLASIRTADAGFVEEAGKLSQQSQQAEEQTRSLFATAATFKEQSQEIRDTLFNESERTNSTLVALLRRLGESETELRDLGTSAEATLQNVNLSVSEKIATLTKAMQGVIEHQQVLTPALETQRDTLNNLLACLAQAQTDTAVATENNVAKLAEGAQHITQQVTALGTQTESALASIRAADAAFIEEASKLSQQAQQTEEQARTLFATAETLKDQSQEIRDTLYLENEKTNEILSSLLNKLNTSEADLRDLGSAVETTLQNVNASVEEKVIALTMVMQNILENQHGLTPVLDEQRETLKALYAQLLQAQEETGAAAESNVTRLAEGADQIAKRIETLGTQAENTLNIIRTADLGFIEEASKLGQQVLQTEEQTRALFATATSFRDQSQQIRDALYAESERTGTALVSLLGKLGASQTELREFGESAEATLRGLHGSVNEQLLTLAKTMQGVMENQKELTPALESQRNILNSLLSRLAEAQDETALATESNVARLAEGADHLAEKVAALGAQAENTLTAVRAADTGFVEEADKLGQQAQLAEEQTRALYATAASLQDQSQQLRVSLSNETEHAEMSLNSLLDKLGTSQTELRDLGLMAESTLQGVHLSVEEKITALTRAMQGIMECQKELTPALETQHETLDSLLARLAQAQNETASATQDNVARLTEGTQQISRQVEALGSQAESALAAIRAADTGFVQEASKLEQQAQLTEQQTRVLYATAASLQDQSQQLREALYNETERTGDTLVSLMNKLSSSQADLRNLGLSSESVLQSLQGSVNEKVTALTRAMQSIMEHEQGLTPALEAQRTALNDLLARLLQAQDETAFATESNVTRLTEGAQQIIKQVDALGSQAQSALTAIRTADAGFTAEAEKLSQQSQQAEQQTRALFATTASLQDQSQQIREALYNESERTNDIMASLLGKIGASQTELRDFTTSAESSLRGLQGTVNEQLTALADAMQGVMDRQRALTPALENQRGTLSELITHFSLVQDETSATAERNVARLTESTQQINRQMDSLEAQAQKTLENVRSVNGSFAEEVERLGQQAQETEKYTLGILSTTTEIQDQARSIRESMQNEAARAADILGNVTVRMEDTVQQLRQQSGNAVNIMDQSVLKFSDLARMTNETLQNQADGLTMIVEQAERRVLDAGNKIQSHYKIVEEAGELTAQQAKQLGESAEYATSRVLSLCSTMAQSEKDESELLAKISARTADARKALQYELQQIAEMSQTAVEQLAAAAQSLATENNSLRTNMAQSEAAINQAAQTVHNETNQLPSALDRSKIQIEATGKAFKEQTDRITDTMLHTTDRFIGVTGSIRDTMMEEISNLGTVADNADNTLRQFNQALIEQISAIKNSTTKLSDEQADLVEKASKTIAQLSASSERLALVRNDTLQTTEKLARDFENIENRAETSAQRLSQVGDNLSKQVQQLAQMTERAEGQMLGASQGFREQLERVRTGVQMQIDDINRGLMQITAQLERTGTTLRSATADSFQEIEKLSNRFDQTGKDATHQISDRTARMRVATEEVAKLLNGFGDQMDVLLDRLSMAGDGIKRHESDLSGQMHQAFTHLGSLAERLEASRVLTVDVSDATIARLTEVSRFVEKESMNLKEGAQIASNIVRGVGQIYTEQTRNMHRSMSDTQGQVVTMNKSIEEMQQRTDRLRVALKLQGDELLNSLEQIMRQIASTGDAMSDTVDQVMMQRTIEGGKRIS